MKKSYKIRLTSARNVKTIIKLHLVVTVPNSEKPHREVRELHFSKDIPMKPGETLLIQDFPVTITEIYTDIRNGHIYKIANVYFNKQKSGIEPLEKEIKMFNDIFNKIVKGLKSNEKN